MKFKAYKKSLVKISDRKKIEQERKKRNRERSSKTDTRRLKNYQPTVL